MKNKPVYKRYAAKALVVLALSLYGSAFSPCHAQTIVGKWKLVNFKEVITDKASGKKQDISEQEAMMLKMMEVYMDFKADHTIINTMGMAGSKPSVDKGTYTLNGDKLTFSTEMGKKYEDAGKDIMPGNGMGKLPNFVTVRFSGGNMIIRYSGEITDEGKAFAFDMENTYQRQ